MIINTGRLESMDQSTLNFIYFLAVIGGLAFIIWIAKLIWSLIKSILPSKNYKLRYGQKTWAVITGGSDGIGLGFCQELAALGFNVCMISRNKAKMQEACAKIKENNQRLGIYVKSIVSDFAECNKEDFFTKIDQQLQGLDISILINNVGISNIGYLHEIPEKRIIDQVNINVLGMTLMSYHLIPKMLKRQKRAAIINISSVAAEYPVPYISTYSATKAYNNFFSQSIEMEYAHKIDVLSLRPMFVESNMSKKTKSCLVASRNQCAQSALKYLGIDYQTNGYYMHRFVSYITSLFPKPILRYLAQSESRKIMEEANLKL